MLLLMPEYFKQNREKLIKRWKWPSSVLFNSPVEAWWPQSRGLRPARRLKEKGKRGSYGFKRNKSCQDWRSLHYIIWNTEDGYCWDKGWLSYILINILIFDMEKGFFDFLEIQFYYRFKAWICEYEVSLTFRVEAFPPPAREEVGVQLPL